VTPKKNVNVRQPGVINPRTIILSSAGLAHRLGAFASFDVATTTTLHGLQL
jgi:hypothetical protein